MKGVNIPYRADELAWLEANRSLIINDYHRAFCEAFGRDDVSSANLHALRKRKGWKTGRTGCFEKGLVPHNKGKPCAPGAGGRHPNARKTQFRKGNRSGVAEAIYKPIGSERISKDGYIERKVHDGLPMQSRWQTVQKIRWEAINGPLPKGMFLKCRDGDRANTDPSNWEPLPRAVLPYLNGHRGFDYEAAEPEVRPAIIAVAKVRHAAKTAKSKARPVA